MKSTDIDLSAIPDTVDILGAEAPPPSRGPQGEGSRRLRQLPAPARAQGALAGRTGAPCHVGRDTDDNAFDPRNRTSGK